MDSTRTVITSEHVIYKFHPDLEARWHVKPGEKLEIQCPDGVHGQIQRETDRYHVVDYDHVNDAVGPIAVEGAEPGDRLIFDIEDIQIPQTWGYILLIPGFGLLKEKITEAHTKIVAIRNGCVYFDDVAIPMDPCIGTIGVAPATGSYNTVIPFDHGGNMDTTAVRAGARIHFPVHQRGGMIAMGDAKAIMGDGEVGGTGVGVPINIFAHMEVVKGGRFERPIIETSSEWQFVGSAETVEAACAVANEDLIAALCRVRGLSWEQAYMLSSLVGNIRISQVVDPLMTVRMAISKAYLPTID